MTLVAGHFSKLIRLYFIYMGLALGAAAALFLSVETWRFINDPLLTIGVCSAEFAVAVLILRIASRVVRFLIAATIFRDRSGHKSPRAKLRMREPATDLGKVAKYAGMRERLYMPPLRGFWWGLFSAGTGEPRYLVRLSFAVAAALIFTAIVGTMRSTNDYSQTAGTTHVIKAGKPVVITSGSTSEIR